MPEASPSSSIYRTLDPARIRETLRRLGDRIAERFPGSGLSAVARDLTDLAERTEAEAKRIARPNVPLRVAMAVAIAVGLLGLGEIVWLLKPRVGEPEIFSFFQGAEAAINLIVIAGAGLFFAITMEDRLKRRQALARPPRDPLDRPRHRHAPADEGSERGADAGQSDRVVADADDEPRTS